jgi:hypothetical protein
VKERQTGREERPSTDPGHLGPYRSHRLGEGDGHRLCRRGRAPGRKVAIKRIAQSSIATAPEHSAESGLLVNHRTSANLRYG